MFSLCHLLFLLINLVTFPAGGEEPIALRAAKTRSIQVFIVVGLGQGRGGGWNSWTETHPPITKHVVGRGPIKGRVGVTSWANVWRYWSLRAIALLRWCHGLKRLSCPRFHSLPPHLPPTARIIGSHVDLEYTHFEFESPVSLINTCILD